MRLRGRRADDIRACIADGKLGILLGYQNTNLLEDRIRYVELFADLGVRVLNYSIASSSPTQMQP